MSDEQTLNAIAGVRQRVDAFNHYFRQHGGVKSDEFDDLEIALAEIDRLTAELAEARRDKQDAGRYRWLRDSRGDEFWSCHEKDGYGGQVLKYGIDLDTAIDAALKEKTTCIL